MISILSFLGRHQFPFFSGLKLSVGRPASFFLSGVRHLSSVLRLPSSAVPPLPKGLRRAGRRLVSGVRCLSAGFTLLEVLVAMTVLSIMVLMVANIFQSSSASWNIGTQKSDMNTAARAALDYMARELACAVAGPIDKAESGGNDAIPFNLEKGNDIQFVALAGEPQGGEHALRASMFRYFNNSVQYKRVTTEFDPYKDRLPTWASFPTVLIANTLSLQISAFTNEYGLANGLLTYVYDSKSAANSNQLPICIDIALTMLSDDDMKRYDDMKANGADTTEFESRNAKVYSTRVYFPNRAGYQAR